MATILREQYLEYRGGNSAKFYHLWIQGGERPKAELQLWARWGKIGTYGTLQQKFPHSFTRMGFDICFDKLFSAKKTKGYQEKPIPAHLQLGETSINSLVRASQKVAQVELQGDSSPPGNSSSLPLATYLRNLRP